jgi:signal transduction histidine kinase
MIMDQLVAPILRPRRETPPPPRAPQNSETHEVEVTRALARARALNTKFIRTLAHDLREPVRTQSSFAELLCDIDDLSPEQIRDYAGRVQHGAQHLDLMIRELKGFADETNGNGNVLCWTVKDIVASTIDRVAQQIEELGADVRVVVDNCGDVSMPSSLARVLQNLIDNALKYTDEPAKVEVRLHVADGILHGTVADQGMGFDPEDADVIFGMFKQLHPHSQYAKGGTGMGLATCREIVEYKGGKIWATSDGPGHGATIHFEIPVCTH